MNDGLARFAVGEPAPPPFYEGRVLPDGFLPHIDSSGGVYIINYMSRPSREELRMIREPIRFRYVEEGPGLLATLVRFGNSPLIGELDYDATIYPDRDHVVRLFSDLEDLGPKARPLMTLLVIDPSDRGQILELRAVTPPLKLLAKWKEHWLHGARNSETVKSELDAFFRRIGNIPLVDLWKKARNCEDD